VSDSSLIEAGEVNGFSCCKRRCPDSGLYQQAISARCDYLNHCIVPSHAYCIYTVYMLFSIIKRIETFHLTKPIISERCIRQFVVISFVSLF
jgi:hypothetical protein